MEKQQQPGSVSPAVKRLPSITPHLLANRSLAQNAIAEMQIDGILTVEMAIETALWMEKMKNLFEAIGMQEWIAALVQNSSNQLAMSKGDRPPIAQKLTSLDLPNAATLEPSDLLPVPL